MCRSFGTPQYQDHRETLFEVRPAAAGAADAWGDGGCRASTGSAATKAA